MNRHAPSLASVLAGLALLPATSAAAQDPPSYHHACHEVVAFVAVDFANARSFVPARYPLHDNGSGKVEVVVRTYACREHVGGETVDATGAITGVTVDPPQGESSDGACCNWYLRSWASDNRALVAWLKDGLPSLPVRFVDGLERDYDARLAAAAAGEPNYRFRALSPAHSPFTMTALAGGPLASFPIAVRWWHDTPDGRTVKFTATAREAGDFMFGRAEGEVCTSPHTELGVMLGGDCGVMGGLSSSNRWERGTTTKQLGQGGSPGR